MMKKQLIILGNQKVFGHREYWNKLDKDYTLSNLTEENIGVNGCYYKFFNFINTKKDIEDYNFIFVLPELDNYSTMDEYGKLTKIPYADLKLVEELNNKKFAKTVSKSIDDFFDLDDRPRYNSGWIVTMHHECVTRGAKLWWISSEEDLPHYLSGKYGNLLKESNVLEDAYTDESLYNSIIERV